MVHLLKYSSFKVPFLGMDDLSVLQHRNFPIPDFGRQNETCLNKSRSSFLWKSFIAASHWQILRCQEFWNKSEEDVSRQRKRSEVDDKAMVAG